MKTLRILHLSDLHRPPKENEKLGEQAIGVKEDETVSEDFSNTILEKNWENNFIKQIVAWSNSYASIDAIVCTGDLGTKGDPESIQLGAHLVARISDKLKIDVNNVIVCPGNHDLNRDAEICNAFDNFKKYLTEAKIVNFCNGNDVCVISPNGIPIISINSCLGGNQKSAFIKKYSELDDSLTDEERNEFASNIGALIKQSFKDGHYDVPAITNEQRKNLMTAISRETNGKKIDTAIVICFLQSYFNLINESV